MTRIKKNVRHCTQITACIKSLFHHNKPMPKSTTDFLTTVNENKMQQFSRLTNIKKTILRSLSIFDQYSYINWKGSGHSTVLFLEHEISSSNRTHHHSCKDFKARTGYTALGAFSLFTCNRLTTSRTC